MGRTRMVQKKMREGQTYLIYAYLFTLIDMDKHCMYRTTGICKFTSWLFSFVIQMWELLSYLPRRALYLVFKYTVKLSLGS